MLKIQPVVMRYKKHHPEGKNVRRPLHTINKRKRQWYQKKNSEKAISPNKQKEKRKKETRVNIGAPAH